MGTCYILLDHKNRRALNLWKCYAFARFFKKLDRVGFTAAEVEANEEAAMPLKEPASLPPAHNPASFAERFLAAHAESVREQAMHQRRAWCQGVVAYCEEAGWGNVELLDSQFAFEAYGWSSDAYKEYDFEVRGSAEGTSVAVVPLHRCARCGFEPETTMWNDASHEVDLHNSNPRGCREHSHRVAMAKEIALIAEAKSNQTKSASERVTPAMRVEILEYIMQYTKGLIEDNESCPNIAAALNAGDLSSGDLEVYIDECRERVLASERERWDR